MPGLLVIDTTVACFGADGRDSATEIYISIKF